MVNITHTIARTNKNIFMTIKNINPSKLASKMIPGNLIKPNEAISNHRSGIKVLFSVTVAVNEYPNTPRIINEMPETGLF